MESSKTSSVNQYEPDAECSHWIERAPEEIWAYLADVSNEPQFGAELTQLKATIEG